MTPEPRFPNPGRPENQVELLYDGPWSASIEKIGRWRYEITFTNVEQPTEPNRSARVVGSRSLVDNAARKTLNRVNRPKAEPQTWTVGPRPKLPPRPKEPPEPPPPASGASPSDSVPVSVVGTTATAGKTDERPPTFGFAPRRDLR